MVVLEIEGSEDKLVEESRDGSDTVSEDRLDDSETVAVVVSVIVEPRMSVVMKVLVTVVMIAGRLVGTLDGRVLVIGGADIRKDDVGNEDAIEEPLTGTERVVDNEAGLEP
jgi:hypothetical protein